MEKKDQQVHDVEKVDKQKINYRGVKAMPYILGNETFEKLGTIGTSSNMVVYLTTVFNMKSVSATTLVAVFSGTANIAPLIGAFLSDAYFGRFKTLGFASISSLMGMFVITLTAAISKLHPPHCGPEDIGHCIGPTIWQLAFLLCGFVFLISNINWAIGFAIPTFLMFLAVALFFMGSRIYVKVKPEGSPLTGVVQVFVAANKKRRLKLPESPHLSLFNYHPTDSINANLPYTDQFRFLDKAAIITPEDGVNPDGSAVDPWRLCGMQQVEEVKCIMRILPIWVSGIVYYTTIVHTHTYAVLQALQSDRHLGGNNFEVPAASYIVFSMIGLTIWIPIYDRLIVPTLRKFTGKEGGISLLERVAIGFVLSVTTMLVSAIVETQRRNYALTRPTLGITSKGGAISSLPGLWLAPQLILAGLTEAFGSIGQVEFYYKQFPENMRTIAGSFFYCTMAGANYLCGFLVSLIHRVTAKSPTGNWLPEDLNKGRLDYFYYLFVALGILNFAYFLVCARWYRYKGTGGVAIELANESTPTEKQHIV
ncbi:hypothetical protein AQUCO_00200461v1 [Aquilegia coerulea]|uniref:Major facilitator superfamily (MFS) profile domain-containing protein n=1 Tax=Aquilegia coerulea TaxID=218851 RepID=A0A2G5F365_AQUCA|nr:hypothetical protein AQUCO_00200461v1 [Aquilegia coerulea]